MLEWSVSLGAIVYRLNWQIRHKRTQLECLTGKTVLMLALVQLLCRRLKE
jgi:hypothetical protein